MKAATPLALFWEEFRRSPVALAALVVTLAIFAVAALAPVIAPQNPTISPICP